MRKTVLTILGALLIAGSAVQTASASEHNVREAYRGSMATSEQFRNAYNSIEGRANGPLNDNLDFDRRNTFN